MDPFSTGANLAAMVVKMGFKLIIVFSELDSPVAKLVSVSILLVMFSFFADNHHSLSKF